MKWLQGLWVAGLLFAGPLGASAQTEAGVVLSGAFSSEPKQFACITGGVLGCPATANHVNPDFSIEGVLAHSVASFRVATLSLELPVLVIPTRGTNLSGASFTTLAVTPGVRLSFRPKGSASPFLTAGAGIAHFSGSTPSVTKGAVAFAGGVDFKMPISHLTVRAEAKDLITPWPSLITGTGLSNNVSVGAGVVFRF